MKQPQGLKPFDPVVLTWEDAFHATTDQHSTLDAALRDYNPTLRKTVGYYVGEGEKNGRRCVVIATDDDREEPGDECIGGPFYCPIGMAISLEPLQRKAQQKKGRRR